MKNFESFDSYVTPTAGHHVCRVVEFEYTEPERGKPYIAIDLRDKGGVTISTRMYSARVPYFMNAVARQTAGATGGMKFSQVLEYLKSHDLETWVSFHPDYGIQVEYYGKK